MDALIVWDALVDEICHILAIAQRLGLQQLLILRREHLLIQQQAEEISEQEIVALHGGAHLLHRLRTEHLIKRLVVVYQFGKRGNVVGVLVYELADARW